jgi:hypothetical protein
MELDSCQRVNEPPWRIEQIMSGRLLGLRCAPTIWPQSSTRFQNEFSVLLVGVALLCFLGSSAFGSTSISQFGITWTFDHDYPTGQYANGDFWVVGPVNIISLTNNLHAVAIAVGTNKVDGSMVNPNGGSSQGYDSRQSGYNAPLNKGLPGGNPVSAGNPLVLPVNSSLISSVSWATNEVGCPAIDGATGQPRPTTHSMAILTCVSNAPPAGTLRPPYCGSDKSPRFNKSQLDYSKLANLNPVTNTPTLATVEGNFAGPWVDHVTTWTGAALHPGVHMPNYGRDMSMMIGQAAVMLQVDFSKLPGSPSKEKLLIEFTQLGIDLAGVADTGGNWICDGGHFMGRKWPILFAGVILNDTHMKSVGNWATKFQEDQDTFYVSQTSVAITHSNIWNPDVRADALWPYEVTNIGLPEWGIRHETQPERDQLHWTATYRVINNQSYTGWVLAAIIMGQRTAWNHNALFDYVDRYTSIIDTYQDTEYKKDLYIYGSNFIRGMWTAYRGNYSPRWIPNNPADIYGQGQLFNSLRISTASLLPTGMVGAIYNQTLAADGGTPPYTWGVTSGSLPAGLTLVASSGAITGTPTTVTTASLGIRVVDNVGTAITNAFTLMVNSLPVVTLTATAPLAATWGGTGAGSFTVSRSGSSSANLAINFTLSGAASNGLDYAAVSSPVTIPSNQLFASVLISPLANEVMWSNETVVLVLQSGPGYTIGAPTNATVTIMQPPFDSWRVAQFGTNAGNSSIAGDLADPDGDGLNNLMEYALAAPPHTASILLAPTGKVTNDYLTLTYRENTAAPDITCLPEAGGALTNGAWSSTNLVEISRFHNGDHWLVTVRDSELISNATNRFMRLRVTRN